jgi:flagellar FliL protein
MPETVTKETPKTIEPIQEEQAQVATGEKKPRLLIKMLVIFAIMQIALAAGAYFYVKMAVIPKASSGQNLQAKVAESKDAQKEPSQVYLTENIIVNPAGTNGSRYLSTSLGLEHVKSEEIATRMQELTPVIRDIVIAVLSAKTLEELSSPASKDGLRTEILTKVNQAISPYKVDKIYFVDYVLQ